MPESYCARVAADQVTQVIVCASAAWANATLGPVWVYTGTRIVGIGWPLVDGEIVPPTFESEPPNYDE